MPYILYNLGKIDEAKLYYDKALQINANLTSILSEKECNEQYADLRVPNTRYWIYIRFIA